MKRSLLIFVCLIALISALFFFHPYKLFDYFNAEKKVASILADPTIRKSGLGEDSEIVNVKYLGSHMYYIETEENTYVLEIKTSRDTTRQSVQIFEHKQWIEQFRSN